MTRGPVVLLLLAAAACVPPGRLTPSADVAGLMRRSHPEALDSAALRALAARAALPLPDRFVGVFTVPGATFACPWRPYDRCYGAYLAGQDGEADLIFLAQGARWPAGTLQHELLHFLTHTAGHPDIFRRLGLLGLD